MPAAAVQPAAVGSARTSAPKSTATPTTMNVSARLKAGQALRSRKSVTCPRRTRSKRFARLPPSTSPRATGSTGCRRPARAKNQSIHATAIAVTAITNVVRLAKSPKAIPEFWRWWSENGPTRSTLSPTSSVRPDDLLRQLVGEERGAGHRQQGDPLRSSGAERPLGGQNRANGVRRRAEPDVDGLLAWLLTRALPRLRLIGPSRLLRALVVDAEPRPGHRMKAFLADRPPTCLARSVRAVVDPAECVVDLLEDVLGVLLEPTVELAHEASRWRCRRCGRRCRSRDRPVSSTSETIVVHDRHRGPQALALGLEHDARAGEIDGSPQRPSEAEARRRSASSVERPVTATTLSRRRSTAHELELRLRYVESIRQEVEHRAVRLSALGRLARPEASRPRRAGRRHRTEQRRERRAAAAGSSGSPRPEGYRRARTCLTLAGDPDESRSRSSRSTRGRLRRSESRPRHRFVSWARRVPRARSEAARGSSGCPPRDVASRRASHG